MKNINIDPKIRSRYSPRIYTEQIPEEKVLMQLFEAARWAASARNTQPWRFIYGIKNSAYWSKLLLSLTESNQIWAKEAPVLVLTLVKTFDRSSGRQISKGEYGLGLAIGNLTHQAGILGLGLRNMAGFDGEMVSKLFDIPDYFNPMVMLSIGYPGNPDTSDQNFLVPTGENRQRRQLDQLIYKGEWSSLE